MPLQLKITRLLSAYPGLERKWHHASFWSSKINLVVVFDRKILWRDHGELKLLALLPAWVTPRKKLNLLLMMFLRNLVELRQRRIFLRC